MHPPIYDLILDIRAAFRALRGFSDRMNEARGITAARRAVMEYLAEGGSATVPTIAEAKSVTRQHIQTNADELVAQGLAEWSDNPAHRRSRLLRLSAHGSKVFADIRREEAAYLQKLGQVMDTGSVAGSRQTLQELCGALAKLHPGAGGK